MAKKKEPKKGQEPPKERFPRITTSAKLKSYTRDKDGIALKFKDLVLPRTQQDILDEMLDSDEDLTVTLAASQGRLPFKQDK